MVVRGAILLNRALLEWVIPSAKFQISGGINQRHFKGPLEVHWVNSFIKLHCYLTKGFEWGRGPPPLLNRVLLGWLIPSAKFQISPEWA